MIRITLSELIASTTPHKGVNELAMKIGQIRKWKSREMDQSLEEEHFVAKRNNSRKAEQINNPSIKEFKSFEKSESLSKTL